METMYTVDLQIRSTVAIISTCHLVNSFVRDKSVRGSEDENEESKQKVGIPKK
jgi:hypothetical protein